MALTAVDICTRALVKLGGSPIQSLSEDTFEANICANLYPGVKDAILSAYDWRFTLAKRKLARLDEAPLTKWTYAFQLPSDRASPSIIGAYNSDAVGTPPFKDWEVHGANLLCNFPEVWIDYQTTTNEASWPPYFAELMVNALAAEIAYPVTDQANLADLFHRKAYGVPEEGGMGGLMRTARTRNAQEDPPQVIQDFTLIEARFGGLG